ncbi:MAG TPA: hypothetical protein VL172_19795, partial [Kofleriaceae bacterium]|nr:hypothetical protein [Kofleriaceae bacterium]
MAQRCWPGSRPGCESWRWRARGALTARLYEIRKEERALLVEFLHYLNELDRRRTVLELGFSSLFVFCT